MKTNDSSHSTMAMTAQKKRTCLGIKPDGTYCGKLFLSRGPEHRKCPTCLYHANRAATALAKAQTWVDGSVLVYDDFEY